MDAGPSLLQDDRRTSKSPVERRPDRGLLLPKSSIPEHPPAS